MISLLIDSGGLTRGSASDFQDDTCVAARRSAAGSWNEQCCRFSVRYRRSEETRRGNRWITRRGRQEFGTGRQPSGWFVQHRAIDWRGRRNLRFACDSTRRDFSPAALRHHLREQTLHFSRLGCLRRGFALFATRPFGLRFATRLFLLAARRRGLGLGKIAAASSGVIDNHAPARATATRAFSFRDRRGGGPGERAGKLPQYHQRANRNAKDAIPVPLAVGFHGATAAQSRAAEIRLTSWDSKRQNSRCEFRHHWPRVAKPRLGMIQ